MVAVLSVPLFAIIIHRSQLRKLLTPTCNPYIRYGNTNPDTHGLV